MTSEMVTVVVMLVIGMLLLRTYYKRKDDINKQRTLRLWQVGGWFFIVGAVVEFLNHVVR